MKQLALPFLLAALLAGCAGTPSREAAIEDRGVRAEEAAPADGARIVEATRVETRGAAAGVPVSEAATRTDPGTRTAASVPTPVSERPVKAAEPVQTHGMVAPSSEATPLADGHAGDTASPAAGQGAGAGQGGVDAQATAATDGSLLPPPDAAPTWGDLSNPASPLSKRRLLFDYDSSAIRDDYRAVLEAHAAFMKGNQEARAILQGHADERGSREYNLALGQRRAESVFKALNLLGVPEAQMEAVSFGEEKPVVDGHDEAAWQENRRVEVLYQGE